MAIIDREGLFKGRRLRKCSAAARWRWPYLFLMSNGYARIELDYESIADEFSSFRESAPTPEELRETFSEFRANHLVFVYTVNDQEWGQWDCRRTWLKDYKTTADSGSPKPPENKYREWLTEQHGQDWREFHWSKDANDGTFDQSLPKPLPKVPKSFPAECYGGGGGKGTGKEDTSPEPFDPSFDGSQAFEQFCECYPPQKVERGRYVQEAYMKAVCEVARWKSTPTPKAAEWLTARATAYRSEKFPVGMQKWLEKEMYKQGAPAPVQLEPLIDRVRRQRGEIQ
jgi:hypothetical protein